MSWSPDQYGSAGQLSQVGHRLVKGVETGVGCLARTARALAFWTAVGLPFVYLPLIVGGVSGQQWLVVAGLLVAHVVALIAGHDYARDSAA